jgi:hypothetical protein
LALLYLKLAERAHSGGRARKPAKSPTMAGPTGALPERSQLLEALSELNAHKVCHEDARVMTWCCIERLGFSSGERATIKRGVDLLEALGQLHAHKVARAWGSPPAGQ